MSGQRNAEEIRTSSKLKLAFPSSRHRVSEKLQKLIPVINLPLRFNSSEKNFDKNISRYCPLKSTQEVPSQK